MKKNQYISHGAEMENKLDFARAKSMQTKKNRLFFLVSSMVISSETQPHLERHCLDAITHLLMSVKIPTGVSGTQPSLYTVIMNYE